MSVWTREAMEKLIRLYRNHPCLYNSHLREYRDQTVKKRAWEFLRNNLQDVRSGVTPEQVKSKINSMRSQLSAEYAKLRYNQNYEPKLWFFNQLEFLREFTRNASAERNTPTPNRMDESFDDSSRGSTPSRNSISSPASFYDTQSRILDSPHGRMRTGISSPAPSLYGEEAEPFVEGAARKLAESNSFELSAVSDDIPTTSQYTTAAGVNSSIFDRPTAGSIHISSFSSPNMSPINNRNNEPVNNNSSVFRVPVSSTPLNRQASQANAAVTNNDNSENSRIFSPPRRLIINEDDVKNTYEIIVVSDSEASLVESRAEPLNVKTERGCTYEMYTQTEDLLDDRRNNEEPQPVRVSSSEISTQTDEHLQEIMPKEVCHTSVQTEVDLEQPLLHTTEPQCIRGSVVEISTQTENDHNDGENEKAQLENVELENIQPENIELEKNVELENPEPENVELEKAQTKIVDVVNVPACEKLVPTEDNAAVEPQPGPSNMEARSICHQGNPINKRKYSPEPVRKKIPTKFEDSDSEYFSADDKSPPSSPVPKKVKVVHVTSETILPNSNFFSPIREMDEDFAFGNLVALKLKPLSVEEKNLVEVKILSAFSPSPKRRFWPF